MNVMIDLETLGVSNNAVILSIGATKFVETEITDTFHVGINSASCQDAGLKIDASTVMWWMAPERAAARDAMAALAKVDLYDALYGFAEWYGSESLPTWGNGASFDNVVLRSAFSAVNIECPWKFWDDRCYRTMKNLAPGITLARTGTHHDARDDAIYQTKHLQKIWESLR